MSGATSNSLPPKFSFGAPVEVTSSNPTKAITSGLAPSASSFTTQPTTIVTTSSNVPFAFGNPKNTLAVIPTAAIPSFGQVTTAPNTSVSTPTFGQSQNPPAYGQTTSPTFQFGAGMNNNSSSTILFGTNNVPKTTSSQLNMFNTTTTAAAAPSFSFGAAKSDQTPTNVFGNTVSANPSVPVFGSNSFGSNTIPITTAQGGFRFGSDTNSNNVNNANAIFGKQSTNTPSFGNVGNPSPSANLFGSASSSAPAPTQSQTPTFGASTNLPKFGSNIPSTPSFGANNNTSTSTNLFGGDNKSNLTFGNTAPVPTATGVFAFGQSAPTTVANNNPNPFGASATTSNIGSPFVFGTQNSTPNTQNTSAFNSTPANKPSPFAFSANPMNTAPSTAPPAFGSGNFSSGFNFGDKSTPSFASAATTITETKPAFLFNTARVAPFGSAPTNVSPFSGNNNNATNSSFSSIGANATDATKAFSFSGQTNTDTNNVFGSASSAPVGGAPFGFGSPPAVPSQNAFQFNAAQPPTANIFSIGPGNTSGTTTTKGRLIRQGTRRLK